MFCGNPPPAAAVSLAMVKKTHADSVKPKQKEEVPGQRERLIRLRTSHGYETSTAFAAFLGISSQRMNNFENGMPLSREIAFLLVKKIPGLSLDWLYFGKADGLPIELARRLGEFAPPGKRTTV